MFSEWSVRPVGAGCQRTGSGNGSWTRRCSSSICQRRLTSLANSSAAPASAPGIRVAKASGPVTGSGSGAEIGSADESGIGS